jgi:Ca2+-binding EF-hand superfamily protein
VLVIGVKAIAGGPGGFGPYAGFCHGPGMMMHSMGGLRNNPLFQTLDTDNNASLSAYEAETGMERLRMDFDTDVNGVLSRTEFDMLFAEMTRGMSEYPFRMLDTDEDGSISAEEMQFPARMMTRVQSGPYR